MWIQREISLEGRPRGFHLVTREVLGALPELGEVAGRSNANCLLAPNFAIGAVLMMEAAKLVAWPRVRATWKSSMNLPTRSLSAPQ